MAYTFIEPIVDLFWAIFGNGYVIALFFIVFFLIMMLIARVNLATMLIVILPVILGFAINSKGSDIIGFQSWIFMGVLLALGLIFAMLVFIKGLGK